MNKAQLLVFLAIAGMALLLSYILVNRADAEEQRSYSELRHELVDAEWSLATAPEFECSDMRGICFSAWNKPTGEQIWVRVSYENHQQINEIDLMEPQEVLLPLTWKP